MPAVIDRAGCRVGRLVAVKYLETRNRKRIYLWQCDCGNTIEKPSSNAGNQLSCGCLKDETCRANGVANRLPFGEASLRVLYGNYERRATKSGRDFCLTLDEFRLLIAKDCTYCGVPPLQRGPESRGINGACTYNGLDRVDNAKGYTFTNVVTCCEKCNRAKGTMGRGEFLEWARRLATNLEKLN